MANHTSTDPKRNVLHQAFEIGIVLKGANAALECLGGLALLFISTRWIAATIAGITQVELAEDPRDYVAGHLLAWAQTISPASKGFYAFYLISHGVIKLALVAALISGKLWAYPASIAVLLGFVAYQVYRFSFTHSLGLVALTLFDLVVLWLIWNEYRSIKSALPSS